MMFQLMSARSYRKRPFYKHGRSLCRMAGASPYFLTKHCLRRGGVSAVPVDRIAEVVQRVGLTSNPVAFLITRDPDSVGLRGYPRQKVRCGLSVMGSEGIRIHTEVDCFMVQLGLGEAVHQNMRGVEVSLLNTMVNMIISSFLSITDGHSDHIRHQSSSPSFRITCPRRQCPTLSLVKVLQPAFCCTPISLVSCSKTQARGEPFSRPVRVLTWSCYDCQKALIGCAPSNCLLMIHVHMLWFGGKRWCFPSAVCHSVPNP